LLPAGGTILGSSVNFRRWGLAKRSGSLGVWLRRSYLLPCPFLSFCSCPHWGQQPLPHAAIPWSSSSLWAPKQWIQPWWIKTSETVAKISCSSSFQQPEKVTNTSKICIPHPKTHPMTASGWESRTLSSAPGHLTCGCPWSRDRRKKEISWLWPGWAGAVVAGWGLLRIFILDMTIDEVSVLAAVAKYHRLGGLTEIFSQFCRLSSLRSRCQQLWFLLKPLSMVCRWPFSSYVFTWSSVCACDQIWLGQVIAWGPILVTTFQLNDLIKDLTSKYSHILRN
jgi:hypothetical protein